MFTRFWKLKKTFYSCLEYIDQMQGKLTYLEQYEIATPNYESKT